MFYKIIPLLNFCGMCVKILVRCGQRQKIQSIGKIWYL